MPASRHARGNQLAHRAIYDRRPGARAALNAVHFGSTRHAVARKTALPGQGRRKIVTMKAPRAAARRHLSGSPFAPPAPAPPPETFAVHDQVTHDKYGLGIVLGVED